MCVRQDVRFVSESASSQLRGGGHRSLGLNATSTSMFDRFLQAFSIFCHNFARDPSQLTRLVVIGGGVDRREGVAEQGGGGWSGNNYPANKRAVSAGVPSCGNQGRQTRSPFTKPVSRQHGVFNGMECCNNHDEKKHTRILIKSSKYKV